MKGLSKRLISIYLIVSLAVFQHGVDFQMMMFTYYPPQHFCHLPNVSGVLVSKDNCHYTLLRNNSRTSHKCKSWTFDNSQILSTVVTDLSLVCQYQYLHLMILPLRNMATIFSLSLAFLSDVKGRKIIFLVSIFLDSVLWVLLGLLPLEYVSHLILRCLKVFGSAAAMVGFVLASEITPIRFRNILVVNFWIPFGFGIAASPLYVYLTRHWKSAYLLSALPCIFYLAAPFVILESPKWLQAQNRKEEADEVAIKIKTNPDDGQSDEVLHVQNVTLESDFCKELGRMMCSCTMVSRFLTLSLSTFAFYLVYQGISTNLQFANSNIFINAFIMGLIEVPSGPLSSLLCNYIGTLPSTVLAILLAIFFYTLNTILAISVLNSKAVASVAKLIFACIVKFMISSAWNIQPLYYVILLPTTLRSFVCNISDNLGITGAALGAFLGYYLAERYIVANIVFGGILLLSAVLIAYIIPSAEHKELPQTVEEAKAIKKVAFWNKK